MQESQNYTYRPLGDFVLFRLVNRGEVNGVLMPDIAAQGKERVVTAVGPGVDGLKPGDSIFVIGELGSDVVQLPSEKDVFLTRVTNVVLVVESANRRGIVTPAGPDPHHGYDFVVSDD